MLLLLLCGTGCHRAVVIPKEDMASIYAEMMVMDQWIKINHMSRQADTTLVYLPIIEKYGYTMEDWQKSVGKYSSQPAKYSKIFDRTGEILKKHLDSLDKVERLQSRRDSIKKVHESYKIPRFTDLQSQLPPDRARDTITLISDTLGVWVLGDATRDTTFKGPLLIIKERSGADSLQRAGLDSLKVAADSISAKVDSTKIQGKRKPGDSGKAGRPTSSSQSKAKPSTPSRSHAKPMDGQSEIKLPPKKNVQVQEELNVQEEITQVKEQ